jgi:PAS domain S-box-containing protein
LEIVESDRYKNLPLSEHYMISFRKIGNQIIDIHGYGNIIEFDVRKFQNYIEQFILEMDVQIPFVEMRNYEDLTGVIPRRETLQQQKDFFIKNKDRRIGFIAYNGSKAIEFILKSGQRQYSKYNVVLKTESNYEQAVKSAMEILRMRRMASDKTKQKRFKISSMDIEVVSHLCGRILWEEDIMFDLEETMIEQQHPLYPIVENLMILKEELISLQTDVLKKEKALISEKEQTEKIIESLQSGIVIVDQLNGMIIDANPAACRLFDMRKEILIGKVYATIVEDIQKDYSGFKKKTGIESIVHRPGEHKVNVMRNSIKIMLDDKMYILESIVDITTMTENQEKLKKSLDHTKQLNNLTFNREKRIINMKSEVNELLKELGRPLKYRSVLNIKKD